MNSNLKILIGAIVTVLLVMILTFAFGLFGVGYTTTIGKKQQNANRVVYEESNSFVKGKRQEAIKYYKEWLEAETLEDKKAIETIVSMSLADFDEDRHITDAVLLSWVKRVKY